MAKLPGRVVALLSLAVTAIAAASPAADAKRVALVVGNDSYQSLTPLQKAVNDARDNRNFGFRVARTLEP